VIRVGLVTAPFGLQGAVKVRALTDFADRFEAGSELWLEGRSRRVEWTKRAGEQLAVKLAGLDDRTRAELLRGSYLEVPEEEARELPEGAFYHHQLEGLEVVTESGRALGRVSQVLERPANDVWVVSGEVEQLVPATRDAVKSVDLERRRITVADWLLEVEEA
jgi:16S rRNA processing protein RimM